MAAHIGRLLVSHECIVNLQNNVTFLQPNLCSRHTGIRLIYHATL